MKHLLNSHQRNQLRELCRKYATAPCEDVRRTGTIYLDKLISYNRIIPLISRAGDQTGRAVQLFLSSLAALEFLPREDGVAVADLGSGGGFPAIPLKIARPDTRWILIESKQRKCTFLESIVRDLHLADVNVVCSRIEDYSPGEDSAIGVVTSRAGPPGDSVLKWAQSVSSLEQVIFFGSSPKNDLKLKNASKYGFYLLETKQIGSDYNIASLWVTLFKKVTQ